VNPVPHVWMNTRHTIQPDRPATRSITKPTAAGHIHTYHTAAHVHAHTQMASVIGHQKILASIPPSLRIVIFTMPLPDPLVTLMESLVYTHIGKPQDGDKAKES
jgi:hypothetical protein